MRGRVRLAATMALMLGAFPIGSHAQESEGDPAEGAAAEPAATPDAPPTDREDARRSDEARPLVIDAQGISTPDKQARAEKMLGDMRGALRRVTEILAEARASKDIVQLNCVNEKLTQVKGLLRISEDASVKMYDAIGSGAEDLVNHEFTKITVAHQKTLILRAEAEQCVGELSVYTGETDVSVEIDPNIPTIDPTRPTTPPPGPAIPPPASRV